MDKTLGIYIHIPFCASKCGYCDFYSLAGCDRLMPKYQDALVEHMAGVLADGINQALHPRLSRDEIAQMMAQ